MPIIGVNECGKTTILHAIFGFDHFNDDLNDGGRHLKDTNNLYATSSSPAYVSADVEVGANEMRECLREIDDSSLAPAVATYRKKRGLPGSFRIRRNLRTLDYEIAVDALRNVKLNDELARQIVRNLPFILFFDDFRDSVDEKVEILGDKGSAEGWLSIFEQLFKRTDSDFSVFKLAEMEERQRKSMLSAVKAHLNKLSQRNGKTFGLIIPRHYRSLSISGKKRHCQVMFVTICILT